MQVNFQPSFSYHLSLRPLFCLFLSGCLRQVLLYKAPDKAAYCVFTQLFGPQNALKLFSVRTKTQLKCLILNSELFHSA